MTKKGAHDKKKVAYDKDRRPHTVDKYGNSNRPREKHTMTKRRSHTVDKD